MVKINKEKAKATVPEFAQMSKNPIIPPPFVSSSSCLPLASSRCVISGLVSSASGAGSCSVPCRHVVPVPLPGPGFRPLRRRFAAGELFTPEALAGRFLLSRACFGNSTTHQERGNSLIRVQFFRTTTACKDDVLTVKTPAFAESVTEGDVRWEKAVGDAVREDEVVCEIETDKTSVQVPAPAAGIIEALLVPDGGKVEGGTPLFTLRKTGAVPSKPKPVESAASAAPKPEAVVTPHKEPIPTTMPPVPPVSAQPMDTKPISAVKPAPVPVDAATVKGSRSEHRVKMNRMRQRIAQRLKEAQNTCAMLTTFNEVDMSNIQEMRAQHKDAFLKKHNLKLGFMSAFVKAAAFALQEQPIVNAVIDDATKEIVYRDYIDVSVAVSTPRGLVVPVLRNVETMNFADIERTINELGEKARKNELAIEDMDGGTFTISNGGVFGSLFGTPIINPPQSAILGMHGIFDRPVAISGKVDVRPMMYVALTYDHRLIDGREAVLFLRKIKSAVEDPRILLLDL
ncbi:dihydrolipoyllysine-residue succinyltransferase component of 2-oxoglutarate dehydrogenase complex, mitochondrial [Microcaecilia unicolor]|uniref:Dihydrolipoyllysine-residue succinyltransferase component of 2-oxoglutarate dehydrogenase complex, mitochondrial n=1 Tax=Microcaecilia unicolor TaxID=1415580 RepID=A0A6P7Z2A7_9AMPH|nr:dihydrolipoyllysine-residue succinyltransferase component of 2-oxoglutarate dehydrogenase complex, mitochondrial [Microcaecilia unicolor]